MRGVGFMQKKTKFDHFCQRIIKNGLLFWMLTILSSIGSIVLFLIPFFIREPIYSEKVPPLSYLSIGFFFFCFWLLNKKTGSKE
jgi:uncharacterized membrane protein YhaH (DUF805 family)